MKYWVPFLVLYFLSCNPKTEQDFVIGIGSCNRTDLPQDIWSSILENHPQLFIWLGDIVYGDTHDMSVLRSKYERLKSEPGYVSLRTSTEVIGVWDDHDYGVNDGGRHYKMRDESKLELLKFLDQDSDTKYNHPGAYESFDYQDGAIKIILLDSRYFRDTLMTNPDPGSRYLPNPVGDILGEEQWKWLEEELASSEALIHIIGNGIQVLPEEHGYEKWANFPAARERLLTLLKKYRPEGLLLISGDRHMAEFSELQFDDGYRIREFTSSGMTHSWSENSYEPNRYRVGEKVTDRNFGIIRIEADYRKIKLEIRGLEDSLLRTWEIQL